jgi:hypothetical protein
LVPFPRSSLCPGRSSAPGSPRTRLTSPSLQKAVSVNFPASSPIHKARGVVHHSCSGKEGESACLGRWIYDHFRTFYLNQLPVGAMLINAGSSNDRKAYVLKCGRAPPETNYPDLAAKIFPWAEEALAYVKQVRLSLSSLFEEWGERPKKSSSEP